MAPFSFSWKGKPMAIVLDNDLMTRWLEAQRQINEVQELRDENKVYWESDYVHTEALGADLAAANARIVELETELVQASYQIEELNILALESRDEIERLKEELATLR